MFRCRQKLSVPIPSQIIQMELKPNNAGKCVPQKVNLSKIVLPDPINFDLKTMLEAGLNIEEVDSKVISGGVVDAAAVINKYTEKNSKLTGELKNEN